MVRLETDRLILRMFSADDAESYARICADPEVMRYLGEGKPLSTLEAWRHMAFLVGHWQLLGYGHFAVEEKSSGRLIGRGPIDGRLRHLVTNCPEPADVCGGYSRVRRRQ